MSGKQMVGRYDEHRKRWQISRPYHLFVDDSLLAKHRDEASQKNYVLADQDRIIPYLPTKSLRYELLLADGYRWEIAGENEGACEIISELRDAMQLRETQGIVEPLPLGNKRRLLVRVEEHCRELNRYVPLAQNHHGQVRCILSPSANWEGRHVNLMRLSLAFAREAQAHGGLLMHGALAERDGIGVIMAAPGGTGKTTASNRLKSPWVSLCDDTTLVVRDQAGKYWAHPWPTWSRFQNGGPGGAWDVQMAVPLKGIFILSQAPEDRVERVGPGKGVSLIVESVTQASIFMTMGLPKGELRSLYLEQFNNLCALTHIIRVHVLHISLTGCFWQEIERALGESI
jgi:SynChlorMet cassette protein ScmC